METVYLYIVIFLLCLAVFDLFVGVSNDASNFMQSAVGAHAAGFKTVLVIASVGVMLGAVLSSGMMDVARHGIMVPEYYSFHEVMTIFLAVMVTDILVLDVFNTLGMPTSTTVSLVFELLGGTFMLAMLKVMGDPSLEYADLINSSKALQVIIAIFVSVAISFVVGLVVMWISRIVFKFDYRSGKKLPTAIFGGVSFSALAYFIFLKGVGGSPYLPEAAKAYIGENTDMLLLATFVCATLVFLVLVRFGLNVFRLTVLMGTFALAMAFAGNDLVNFIGVPLAGLDSYMDFTANHGSADIDSFMMTSLMETAKTHPIYLFAAGLIMVVSIAISKKARNVIKTSVDLARQDEGDEMFGSSRAARAIVRYTQTAVEWTAHLFPVRVRQWVNSRFNSNEVELTDDKAAFDMVRAAINLVVASMLITFGTNHKLPLSTTYVTFMVAMGTSLADRAWSRESAVFRVTGVVSVIGGWFITAGVSFIACSLVCLCMWFGGIVVQLGFILVVIYVIWRNNRVYKQRSERAQDNDAFRLMMRTRDPELVWDMLRQHVRDTQANVCQFAMKSFDSIVDAFAHEDVKTLRHTYKELIKSLDALNKVRRQEMLGLKKVPMDIAIERNTWFHVGANSDQQFVYTLRRMLHPVKEHVENNFNPIPQAYVEEFEPIRRKVDELMGMTYNDIKTERYEDYRKILSDADVCKDELSVIRKLHLSRMQAGQDNSRLQVDMVYLNLLQETQQFLSAMRHQLRSSKKFMNG